MRNHERPAALDRSVIAVAPFRVTGADSSLGYLREGMVDLLSTKLSGTAALRPADPRTLLAAWGRAARGGGELSEDDAVQVAALLGAGRMVEGEVVGSRGRVSLSARIVDVPSGSVRARAAAEGSPDSLTQLVDRLAATLLALGSGEGEQRLAGLTSTSLPALRAYLDGEALLRRGRFGEASKKFLDALQIDSTFALAGVGAGRAGEWQTSGRSDAAVKAAWHYRDRLSARDLARLTVTLGPRYPAPPGARDVVETAERLVELAPDSPDAWYLLADGLFHFGALASVPEALPRAVAAFARSLALDSSYAPTLQHLTEVAALLDDTAGVLRGRALLRQIDSVSSFTIARQWHPAVWLGDTAEVRRLLASDSALGPLPTNLLVYALDGAVPLDIGGVEDLYRRAYAQAATAEERKLTALIWSRYELASGRPGKSPPLSRDWPAIGRQSLAVLDGLFADGDSGQAAEGARSLERQLGSRFVAADRDATLARYAVGQYNLRAGNLTRCCWLSPTSAGQSPTQTACGRPTSLAPLRYCSKLNSMRAKAHLKPRSACGSLTPCWRIRGCLSTLSTSADPHSSPMATWSRRDSMRKPATRRLRWPPSAGGSSASPPILTTDAIAGKRAASQRHRVTRRTPSVPTVIISRFEVLPSPARSADTVQSSWPDSFVPGRAETGRSWTSPHPMSVPHRGRRSIKLPGRSSIPWNCQPELNESRHRGGPRPRLRAPPECTGT